MSNFRVRKLDDRSILPGTPSPMLIQQGGGDAFEGMPGYWRARDDKYDPAGTVYTRVRIEYLEDWRVDVTIQPTNPSDEDVEEYPEYFIVEAETEQEAFQLAEAKAREQVEDSYGEEYGSIVTTIRARKGVSF